MKWFKKLSTGLSKTSGKIGHGLSGLVGKKRLDSETIELLTELLISADLGVQTSEEIVNTLQKNIHNRDITLEEIKHLLVTDIAERLTPYAVPLKPTHSPHVVAMVGVNGSGKTTTIGKLAAQLKGEGKNVLLAACDTFRAAAVAQLETWATRTGVTLIKGAENQDPASVAYQALEAAQANATDVLFIDTAGRLQNNKDLMEALTKLNRVIAKLDETAPHDVVLVLDGTVGQNAHMQVEAFKEVANVTGLIITKLDGTSKAGIVLALAEKYKLPIHAIGVGEGVQDLQPFDPVSFATALIGASASPES